MNDFLKICLFSPLLMLSLGLGVSIGEAFNKLTQPAERQAPEVKIMKTPNCIEPVTVAGLD